MKEPTTKPTVARRILHGLQEFAEAVERREPIAERFQCRTVRLLPAPKSYDASRVKKTRKLLNATHIMFASLLGVSVKTVRSWERGATAPSAIACRFMDEIRLNPAYWKGRIQGGIIAH